jgi:GTP-binding protein
MKKRGYAVFKISAATNKGIKDLMYHVSSMLDNMPKKVEEPSVEPEAYFNFNEKKDVKGYEIKIENGTYVITGPYVDRLFMKFNINDSESLKYFEKSIGNKGIIDELKKMGIRDGDTVRMNDFEFDFIE